MNEHQQKEVKQIWKDDYLKVIGDERFDVVTPSLPLDVMGVYIILPDTIARGSVL